MKTAFLASIRHPTPSVRCNEPALPNDRRLDQPYHRDIATFALHEAFLSTGSIARLGELAQQLHVARICSRLDFAPWIAHGQLLSFGCSRSTRLPMFQFKSGGGCAHPSLRPVITLLHSLKSFWEMVEWFAEPYVWLDGTRPANVLATESVAVLQAACADRFAIPG